MDVSRPYTAVASSLDVEVLVRLAATTRPVSGRQVARLVEASQRGVAAALDRLVEQGTVLRQEAGRALLYSLNRDHLATPAVLLLADMRLELLRRLRAAFEAWDTPPRYALMFGSAARADGDTGSDIDLLLVRPDGVGEQDERWRAQVNGLVDDVWAWTGNHAAPVEIRESELSGLSASRPAVWDEIRRDAAHLFGAPVQELAGLS
jgi:predicted nucleotidyltransferase/biotin operon repressor